MSEESGRYPRYDFPGCGSLALVLLIVLLLAAVGVAGAGTEAVQNMAHSNSAMYVDSARK